MRRSTPTTSFRTNRVTRVNRTMRGLHRPRTASSSVTCAVAPPSYFEHSHGENASGLGRADREKSKDRLAYTRPMSCMLADVQEFVSEHHPHGPLTADAKEPAWNGYLLTVACACGVVFERWSKPNVTSSRPQRSCSSNPCSSCSGR